MYLNITVHKICLCRKCLCTLFPSRLNNASYLTYVCSIQLELGKLRYRVSRQNAIFWSPSVCMCIIIKNANGEKWILLRSYYLRRQLSWLICREQQKRPRWERVKYLVYMRYLFLLFKLLTEVNRIFWDWDGGLGNSVPVPTSGRRNSGSHWHREVQARSLSRTKIPRGNPIGGLHAGSVGLNQRVRTKIFKVFSQMVEIFFLTDLHVSCNSKTFLPL
jgi:hypothetical protein